MNRGKSDDLYFCNQIVEKCLLVSKSVTKCFKNIFWFQLFATKVEKKSIWFLVADPYTYAGIHEILKNKIMAV